MDLNEKIDEMTRAVADFAINYAEKNGLHNGNIVDALGRLYVTYAFSVASDKLPKRNLRDGLVGFIAKCSDAMLDLVGDAKEA